MAIALVGRPNVGKSSLFNRLVGRRKSLVWNEEGVTRDRVLGHWKVSGRSDPIELWDLAGWGHGQDLKKLPKAWGSQIELFVFVIDGSAALRAEDLDVLDQLRKLNKHFLVVLNKSDKNSFKDYSTEIYERGAPEVLEISAERDQGIEELESSVRKIYSKIKRPGRVLKEDMKEPDRRILILGRPNAGKSSLLNRLAGTELAIVSNTPGTTRDIVEFQKSFDDLRWEFLDTAGVRKKSKIYRRENPVEIFSTQKALKELERVNYCLLILEPHPKGRIHTQDKKLLKLVRESQKPCVVIVNKWDEVRDRWTESEYCRSIRYDLGEASYLPILCISAKTGYHIKRIYDQLRKIEGQIRKIPTPQLNRFLKELQMVKAPRIARKGSREGKRRTQTQYLRYYYMLQTDLCPPSFQIFTNAPQSVPKDERRFMERSLRENFALEGLPIRIIFRKKS